MSTSPTSTTSDNIQSIQEKAITLPNKIIISDDFSQQSILCTNYHFVFEDEDIPEKIVKSDSILIELDDSAKEVKNLFCFSNLFLAYDALCFDKDDKEEVVGKEFDQLIDKEDSALVVKGLFNSGVNLENEEQKEVSNQVLSAYKSGSLNFEQSIQKLEEWFCLRNQSLKNILDLEESIFKSKTTEDKPE
ncbi:hypothetical protein K502DRAFT_325963 [Neoconidiobolus thromboides FSU 785]|nr:hypothetical protein K502DRAFT_325963 [Neoconidiobolus thromboides FSU 785]